MNNALAIIEGDVLSVRDQFAMLTGGDIRLFEREAGFAIQLLTATDYAIKIASANRQSVINAVTNVAAIGISLNPAKRQAYLVPRDGKICLDIGYIGLLDLAIQSGSLLWGQAELVYQADRFELNGFDKPPTHARNPFAKDRGPVVGAYVVVKTRDGDYLTTTMTIEETFAIRDRSSAWKNGQKGPWKTDEGEMVKKGLALDTPIPTPTGWTTMGDLRVGDAVFDTDGQIVNVEAVSEVKHLRCFRVTTAGGDQIICDDEHRWVARVGDSHASRNGYSVVTINEMHEAKERGLSVTLPPQGPLATPDADLPIDPYLLGYWLGDGSRKHARISVGVADLDSLETAVRMTKYSVGSVTRDSRAAVYTVGVTGGFLEDLRKAGVFGNKHVPALYLRASVSQRMALLAGLLDSDGHIDKARGRVHFYNKNKLLADAVYELAASLGEAPMRGEKLMRGFGAESLSHVVQWRPNFCPCQNPRKAANYRQRSIAPYRAVQSIEVVDTVATRCIAVSGPSETFLAGRSMTPTHNTVIKRAYKLWPKTDRLDKAVHFLNTENGEGLAELDKTEPTAPPIASVGGASARDVMRDALMAMSPEAQDYMRELGSEVEAIFANPEAGIVQAFDRIEIDNLDNDQRMALWYLLPSHVRSGLKREGEARRLKVAA